MKDRKLENEGRSEGLQVLQLLETMHAFLPVFEDSCKPLEMS